MQDTPCPSGMAGAMARILCEDPSAKRKGDAAVLSKAAGSLRRERDREASEKSSAAAARAARRKANLMTMVVPTPYACPAGKRKRGRDDEPEVQARRIEAERALRRVATRGAVALFNAIRTHQSGGASGGDVAPKGATKVVPATKESFLELVKSKAAQSAATAHGHAGGKEGALGQSKKKERGKGEGVREKGSRGWNVLRKDYITGAGDGRKLKDWDREDTDSGSDDSGGASMDGGEEEDAGNWSDDGSADGK